MSARTISLTDDLLDYLLSVSIRDSVLLQRLRKETMNLPEAEMQISPEQGQFMAMVVRLMQARRIIEVGTFTGYSALCMALALPEEGKIICCDISKEWTAIGQRYWVEAGIAGKIDCRIAPALETLNTLVKTGFGESFDMVFIDADKENYLRYYEAALPLLRKGGLILVDNTLWSGAVIDKADQSVETVAIREFNAFLHKDQRVTVSLLPIGDGLTLAHKC